MDDFFDKIVGSYKPDFAIAYGSGVFKQEGYVEGERPMVDFVFGVRSPREWHRVNMKNRSEDYSLVCSAMGAGTASFLQKSGAGLFYNPYVDFEGCLIKYGVISLDDLEEDLRDWNTLYVAGRMHKPIRMLKSSPEIDDAQKRNLEMAVGVARLLLPENFSEIEFYEQIAGISYLGDSRMKLAENPQKVGNIVNKNLQGFRDLYKNVIAGQDGLDFVDSSFEQNCGHEVRGLLYDKLPENIQRGLTRERLGEDGVVEQQIEERIAEIVSRSSKVQTVKGLISAGPIKSFRYVREKMTKARRN